MNRRRMPVLPIALLVCGIAAITFGPPLRTATPLQILAAIVGIAGLVAAERSILALQPIGRRRNRSAPAPSSRVETQLHQYRRAIEEAAAGNWGVFTRLRPLLRDITRERLAFRGVDLDTDPVAETLVQPRLWEVVRPHQPRPDRRDEPGLAGPELAALLDAIDRL